MGQFSWVCGLCDQEVMHGRQPGYEWTKEVAILWPNGDIRRDTYEDGYGNIAGINLADEGSDWRLVHQRCLASFEPSGDGSFWNAPIQQVFAALKPERHASDQGWWPGERLAVERYGPPNMEELKEEHTYVCYGCRRTWKAKWSGGVCPFGCERPDSFKEYEELVEPFNYLDYRLGVADGVIVCRNERAERPDWAKFHANRDKFDSPPVKIVPCFRFGSFQQARVTKPEDWEETDFDDGGPFEVRCRSCKSTDVEILDVHAGEPFVESTEEPVSIPP